MPTTKPSDEDSRLSHLVDAADKLIKKSTQLDRLNKDQQERNQEAATLAIENDSGDTEPS